MKTSAKISMTIILSMMIIFLYDCSEKTQEHPVTVLSGKITNPKTKFVVLSNGAMKFRDTVAVDESGLFKTKSDSFTEGYWSLSHGDEYTDMFLSAGDSVHMTFNTEQFDETMNYEGKGAEKNNYLAQSILLNEQDTTNWYILAENDFRKKSDSAKKKSEQRLKIFLDSFPSVSETFGKYEQGKILYSWAARLIDYPGMYAYYAGGTSPKTPDGYYGFLSNVKKEDESLMALSEYKMFLRRYCDYKVGEAHKKDSTLKKNTNASLYLAYKIAKEEFASLTVKEYLLHNILFNEINNNGTTGIDSLLSDYKSFNTNKEYEKQIFDSYEKWKRLAKNNPAPVFNYADINGKKVSLSDFSGKIVYIDVWATWCGPCKREIPFLEKVQEEFKKANVVFVSVSIDDDKSKWEQMVKEKSMKGIQLFAEGAWKSEIAGNYNISGIPRFILIGKNGEIIDADAPRPSDEKLKEMLKELAM